MKHVCANEAVVGQRAQRNKPLLLAAIYSEGLIKAKWASAEPAAVSLGMQRKTIARAISIAALRCEVLALFPNG